MNVSDIEEHLLRGSWYHHSVNSFSSPTEPGCVLFPQNYFVALRKILSRSQPSSSSAHHSSSPILFTAEIHVSEDNTKKEFRVFSQLGTVSQMSLKNSKSEYRSVSSFTEALCVFSSLIRERSSSIHGFKEIDFSFISSGSSNSFSVLNDNVSQFLKDILLESASTLVTTNELSIGSLLPTQVDKAISVLYQISEKLTECFSKQQQQQQQQIVLQQLSNEFFSQIPTVSNSNNEVIDSPDKLSKWFETCQLIKDLHGIGESSIDLNNNNTNDIDSLYFNLGCDIEFISSDTAEFSSVSSLVSSKSKNGKFDGEIIKLFRVNRPTERNEEFSSMPCQELLFHGTRSSSVLGILARGLKLPAIVVSQFGIERTNAGLLGSGLYFSNDISTSIKYATPVINNGYSKSRFIFVCKVALGKQLTTNRPIPNLKIAPNGYDSVHWIKDKEVENEEGDEFCIYNERQQVIQYILEVSANDIVQIPAEKTVSKTSQIFNSLGLAGKSVVQDKSVGLSGSKKKNKQQQQQQQQKKCGLEDSNGTEVLLEEVQIKAKIVDFLAEVSVFQQFNNNTSNPIEAKYVFPLDEKSAVIGFEAWINQKHVIGIVKEKEKAHEEYREAIERGDGAYLLDEAKDNVFTVSVGNVPPNTKIVIKIKYVTEIRANGDLRKFVLPSTLAPRQLQAGFGQLTQKATRTAEAFVEKGSKFDLEISVNMPYLIQEITSTSHTILVKKTATKAVIKWDSESDPPITDFSLDISIADLHQPYLWIEESDGHSENAAMLVLYPQMEVREDAISENILIIDSSNSMQSCISDTKLTASLIVKDLPQLSFFNVFVFGSTFDSLFLASFQKNDQTILKAKTIIEKIDAKKGASNLWNVLKFVFLEIESQNKKDRDINLFLLSDGDFSNEGNVFQIAQNHCKREQNRTRIFTFGMGNTIHRSNLIKLSRIGGGATEFISESNPLRKQVSNQIKRSSQASFSGITTTWTNGINEIEANQTPASIKSLFSGERSVIYAFVSENCSNAIVSANDHSNCQTFKTNVVASPATKTNGILLHSLCARSCVRDWEDGNMNNNNDNLDEVNAALEKMRKKQEITDLAIEYSLATSLTSFIAIEERSEAEKQQNWGAMAFSTPTIKELCKAISIDEIPYCTRWELQVRSVHSETSTKFKGYGTPVKHETIYDFWKIAPQENRSGNRRGGNGVQVQTLTGKTMTVSSEPCTRGPMNAYQLKQRISAMEGIPIDQQRLFIKGKALDDDDLIENGDTIQMALRLRGGADTSELANQARCALRYVEKCPQDDLMGLILDQNICSAEQNVPEMTPRINRPQNQKQKQRQPKDGKDQTKSTKPTKSPPPPQQQQQQKPPQMSTTPKPTSNGVKKSAKFKPEPLVTTIPTIGFNTESISIRVPIHQHKAKEQDKKQDNKRKDAISPIGSRHISSQQTPLSPAPSSSVNRTHVAFNRGVFREQAECTIGAAFSTVGASVGGKQQKIELWDTAGQERYRSLAPMYYRGAVGAIIVFDLTRRDTFEMAFKWIQELKLRANPNITVVLLGNKLDLVNERQIEYREAFSKANEENIPYFEVSCKTIEGVTEAMAAFYEDIFSWNGAEHLKVVFLGDSGVGKSSLSNLLKNGTVELPDPSRLHSFGNKRRNLQAIQSRPQRPQKIETHLWCLIL